MQVSVSSILMPIGYNVLALGGIYGLKGIVKLADLGYDIFQWCKKGRETMYINDDLLLDIGPVPKWKRGVRVIQGFLDTAHNGGMVCLTTLVGASILVIGKDLGPSSSTGLNIKI